MQIYFDTTLVVGDDDFEIDVSVQAEIETCGRRRSVGDITLYSRTTNSRLTGVEKYLSEFHWNNLRDEAIYNYDNDYAE